MTVDHSVFDDPQSNLDYDDELLRRAENGAGERIRFWESSSYFIVLGRTGVIEDDVHVEAAAAGRIPVLRRSSGGGTVLQGPGCLNFAVILSKKANPALESISGSYRCILEKVIAALATQGVLAEFRPVCDLVLSSTEKKFSGNAQRRGRDHILHHGTILHSFDLVLVSRYLKMPQKMPDYRNARPHDLFVTNIPVVSGAVRDAVAAQFL
jgi:lipoate-protein ligase A